MTLPAETTLVADIGGTNTRVALATTTADHGISLLEGSVRRYRNQGRDGLSEVIAAYRAETGAVPVAACVAGAGPVMDGVLKMTNLSWVIDDDCVRDASGATQVAVLNDLQAQGHALGHLGKGDLRPLLHSDAATGNAQQTTRLVIGLGTGVNIAMVFQSGGLTLVPPSEAGHMSLALRNPQEQTLAEFLLSEGGFPSVEEALSGRGLEALYRWRRHEGGTPGSKPPGEIMAGVADGSDQAAIEAAQYHVTFAGRVAGDLALAQLPFGGIYFIGGVSRSLAPHFDQMGFGDAFCDKGRFSEFMAKFPVYLIENDDAALLGCASHMAELLAHSAAA
ncbi:glucokinase [Phaeobacter sp. J2-8]|uniref:glucokinase n=1 Tax=Phaeobacter sp. J2-8 TaxID=2931394 RepID=UPI001FD08C2F|nr:glucokinase [Phaeobacter sp. J2-8]MCJ7872045.1 glucokinase [Phaeobacter sp. J2-8]